MTNLTECEKHEMIGCQVCSPPPRPLAQPDSHPFTAKYDGQCSGCDLPIHAGRDRIIIRDRATTYAIHEECM